MHTIETLRRSGVAVAPEATIKTAAGVMERAGVGALGVVDDGRLIGIVTDRDLVRRAMARRPAPRWPRRRSDDRSSRHDRRRRRRAQRVRIATRQRRAEDPRGPRPRVHRNDHHRRPAGRPCRRPRRPRQANHRRDALLPPRVSGPRDLLTLCRAMDLRQAHRPDDTASRPAPGQDLGPFPTTPARDSMEA
jgi:hypothetical protein